MDIQHKTFQILPPAPDKCQMCAVEHQPNEPHDATSLFYQVSFQNAHGRSATWNDAMAHCSAEVQEAWRSHLQSAGIDPSSTNVRGKYF